MIAVASHANREQKERIRHTELRNREDTIKRELHINFWSSIRESRGTSIVTRTSSLHLLTNLKMAAPGKFTSYLKSPFATSWPRQLGK